MAKPIPEQFFEKLKNGLETEEDHLQFFNWMTHASESEIEQVFEEFGSYFEHLADESHPESERLAEVLEKRLSYTGLDEVKKKASVKWSVHIKRVAVAASLFFTVSLAFYLSRKTREPQLPVLLSHHHQIIPGSHKATLVLADGAVITLDSAKTGMIHKENNVEISKSAGGQLVYNDSKFSSDDPVNLNTLNIPRGGEYRLILPDGSKVWLNAQSSLTFPTHFQGRDRKVKLTGEAYFEISKDKAHPFKVSVNDMEVKVLGTHFNIMAYPDEASVKTTLLEGSVKITKGQNEKVIIPGEQAVVSSDIHVVQVNVEEAVEWKNGNFNFSHENLTAIMRKISRWYDVDIAYQGRVSMASFVGTIPKSADITDVLKYLELTGMVHFKITERRITVMP